MLHKWLYMLTSNSGDLCAYEMMSGQITNPMFNNDIKAKRDNTLKSPEMRKKLSSIAINRYKNPKEREKTSEAISKTWDISNDRKKILSDRMKKNNPSKNPSTRKKISDKMKNQKKEKCPFCDRVMGKSNLAYHIKCKHPSGIDT